MLPAQYQMVPCREISLTSRNWYRSTVSGKCFKSGEPISCGNLPGTLPLWQNPLCRGAAKGVAEGSSLLSSKAADLGVRHHRGEAFHSQPGQDDPAFLELGCQRDLGGCKWDQCRLNKWLSWEPHFSAKLLYSWVLTTAALHSWNRFVSDFFQKHCSAASSFSHSSNCSAHTQHVTSHDKVASFPPSVFKN